jgi:iron complex outermembrane receptor protein
MIQTTQFEASGQHQTLSFSLSRILRQFPLLSLWWGGLFFVLLPCSGALGEQHQGHGTEATVLDTLVVTTDRISEFTENNPHMVVVLGRKEMQERNMLSAEEALGTMAGVEVKRSSGVGSRISIRGSGKSGGVLVLLNGRPLNSSQYGGVDLASIPIDIIESITVFKPPVPVWLGPGGSDGAVSIVTRETAPKGKDDKKQATRLRTTAGSYGSIEGNVTHNAKLDSGSAMASATGKHRDGKRTNSDSDSGNLLLHWENELADKQKLAVDGRYYGSEYGSPGPLDNPTPDARQTYEKASLDSRLTGLAGVSGDYAVNLYGDSIHLEDQSQSGFVSTLDDVKVGLKGAYNWSDAADQWAVRTSAILENDALEHTLSGNHDRITAGLGVQADRKWQAVTVTSGVRGDQVTDFGLNPGLSGGMSYALAERWSLKANVGHSVNIPTFGQLYQPSHGSIDQSRGNPDLDKEKILSTDAGFEYRWDKSRFFQLTFFRADTQDPILYQRGIDLIYRPVNGDRSWRHGLEANWKYGFDSGMTMDADVIVQDSEVEETGNELTYTPRIKATLSLLYTLKGPGTRLETSARYNGKQYSEMENREEQRLDDYVTVDFKAIQPFKLKATDVEWFLTVENLFDTGYQIHFGYPDDGIRLVSGFNFRF